MFTPLGSFPHDHNYSLNMTIPTGKVLWVRHRWQWIHGEQYWEHYINGVYSGFANRSADIYVDPDVAVDFTNGAPPL